MTERTTGPADVTSFLRQEAEAFASGVVDRLQTYAQIAATFGYSVRGINNIVTAQGIGTSRREARIQREKLPFPPSEKLAWVLGYLSASSTFKTTAENTCLIRIAEPDMEKSLKLQQ